MGPAPGGGKRDGIGALAIARVAIEPDDDERRPSERRKRLFVGVQPSIVASKERRPDPFEWLCFLSEHRRLARAGIEIVSRAHLAANARPPSKGRVRDVEYKMIQVTDRANLGVYANRTVHAALNREGVALAGCTDQRLMR